MFILPGVIWYYRWYQSTPSLWPSKSTRLSCQQINCGTYPMRFYTKQDLSQGFQQVLKSSYFNQWIFLVKMVCQAPFLSFENLNLHKNNFVFEKYNYVFFLIAMPFFASLFYWFYWLRIWWDMHCTNKTYFKPHVEIPLGKKL